MNISNPHLTNAPNTGKISPRARAHITRGDVAQLGEHHVRNVGVVGSNPIISTTETNESSSQRRGLALYSPNQAFRYFLSRVVPSAMRKPCLTIAAR